MRILLPLAAAFLSTGASAETPAPQPAPVPLRPPVFGPAPTGAICRDRIQEVRRENGKPALDRDAAPEDPLFIAAVDKRIGGCSVLVMRDDTSDIRPLPGPREHRVMPSK